MFWLTGRWFSIGSLGKDQHEVGVQNITVKTVTFTNTQNGLRIKSWGRPSTGFARNILFKHAVMVNVQNPIVIDQNYCPDNKGCPGQVRYVGIEYFFASSITTKFSFASSLNSHSTCKFFCQKTLASPN